MQIEGVPAGRLMTDRAQLLVRSRPKLAANHHPGSVLAQRLRRQHARRDLGQHRGKPNRVSALTASHADCEQHWQRIHTPRQIHEEPRRGRIEPVRVIDRQQQRAVVSQICHKPVQAMQHPGRPISIDSLRATIVEHRRGQPCSAVEQCPPRARTSLHNRSRTAANDDSITSSSPRTSNTAIPRS